MTDIKRSPADITARITFVTERTAAKDSSIRDLHGVERSRLLEALPFSNALKFLQSGHQHTDESWEKNRAKTVEAVREEVIAYLEFAWSKANGSRGTSAQRSLAHFRGLLWLMGDADDGTLRYLEEEEYRFFGKPALVKISEFVGVNWRELDNDKWIDEKDDEPMTANVAMGL